QSASSPRRIAATAGLRQAHRAFNDAAGPAGVRNLLRMTLSLPPLGTVIGARRHSPDPADSRHNIAGRDVAYQPGCLGKCGQRAQVVDQHRRRRDNGVRV
ncbi:MAG TPA: hypothetical protein VFB50_02190, partial [Chloroflexota bacterium]|nr:hypothetical protein [Chloroflexota bacterium]